MSAAYRIQSVCECQAVLTAELNEARQVLHGFSSHGRFSAAAPANSVGADGERFDVVWLCPRCGRNTLRTFYAGALVRLPVAEPAAAAEEANGDEQDAMLPA